MSIWKRQKKAITFAELMISLVVISIVAAILYPTIAQFTPNVNKPLFKSAYNTLSTALSEIVNSQRTGELPTGEFQFTETNEDGTFKTDADGNPIVHNYTSLCSAFCDIANVVDVDSAEPDCARLCADGALQTSNGMRWIFGDFGTYPNPDPNPNPPQPAQIAEVFQVIVDVNASNNDLPGVGEQNISGSTNGVFYYTPDVDADTGIYYSASGCTDAAGTAISCLPTLANPEGTLHPDRIKTQDTFIILVDKNGKIVSMSPAGWAHLSDSLQSPD